MVISRFKPVTVAEKILYQRYLSSVLTKELFDKEMNKIRQELGKVGDERLRWFASTVMNAR